MVNTTPHGEGNIRDHINTEYDPDEDGQVDEIGPDTVGPSEIDPSAGSADEVLVYDGTSVAWDDTPIEVRNGGGLVTDRVGTMRLGAFITPGQTGADFTVDFDKAAFVADTDAAEFTGEGGSSGQVLTTDGTSASWQDPGSGGGAWTHDGTFGNSASDSVSYTLANQYDQVRVYVTSQSGTDGTELDLRINGNTSGYSTRRVDGSSSSEGFVKHVLTVGHMHGALLHMDGVWANNFHVSVEKGVDITATSPPAASTGQYNGGSTLSSFEIFDDAATSFTIQGEVFGRNIP